MVSKEGGVLQSKSSFSCNTGYMLWMSGGRGHFQTEAKAKRDDLPPLHCWERYGLYYHCTLSTDHRTESETYLGIRQYRRAEKLGEALTMSTIDGLTIMVDDSVQVISIRRPLRPCIVARHGCIFRIKRDHPFREV